MDITPELAFWSKIVATPDGKRLSWARTSTGPDAQWHR
ncbi:unnamed protein product [Euphydryas editha]|uniref:Uncharacterized protein n=1 Tax=Euphydryas editha TaxID=104508 RepID=A0AAU9TDP7_EUPED|nr:unnamed protein product [Euphydryas editha]